LKIDCTKALGAHFDITAVVGGGLAAKTIAKAGINSLWHKTPLPHYFVRSSLGGISTSVRPAS